MLTLSGNAITKYYLHADIVNIILSTQKTLTNFNFVEIKVLAKTYIDSFFVLLLVQSTDTQFGCVGKAYSQSNAKKTTHQKDVLRKEIRDKIDNSDRPKGKV